MFRQVRAPALPFRPGCRVVVAKRFAFGRPHCHMRAMDRQPTTLERAFDLARSGDYASVADIRQQLKRERYDQVEAHLAGHSINRELRALCEAAQRERA